MANQNSNTTPRFSSTEIVPGDLIENREYPWVFGVVIRADWTCGGRVPGFVVRCDGTTGQRSRLDFIPADLARLLHRDEPEVIAVMEDVRIAAQASPAEHVIILDQLDPFADKNAFVTPDGRVWPCHNGQHGFTAAKIIADLGEEAVSGALMLGSDGAWMQEGQTGTMTEKQAESVELLAQFPGSGIKTAAIDILSNLAVTAEETPVTAVDASRSQRDSVTVTARRLGDALSNENDNINGRLAR